MEPATPSSNNEPGGSECTTPQRSEVTGKETPERDFGDSAGYGTGGSAHDYHEVLGEDAPAEEEEPPKDPFAKFPRQGGNASAGE